MKTFEMNQTQMDALMAACKPVAMIALQCRTPSSPQENANNAWEKLGQEMGFDHMTVRPISGKSQLFFTAECKSTP